MTVPNDATEGTEQPAKKPGMMPIIGAALVGILIGAAAGSFVIGPKLASSMHIGTLTAADSAKLADAEAEAPAGKEGKGGKEGATNVHMIENLVLNPAGSNGARFLLVSVGLTMNSTGAAARVKEQDAEVRDIVLRVLGSRSINDLSEVGNRERLKQDILVAVDSLFKGHSVKSVYFPQFVLQ
ncbi:MAG: flagellar basal body-associated FliL family protein [Gemmatimonadetes bacterium]|nr:flagellar basal body-associated FliL family protein [Gemmatimonadota bacterium]